MTLLLQRKIRRRTEGVGHRRMEQLWTLVGATQVVMQRQEFGAGAAQNLRWHPAHRRASTVAGGLDRR